MVSSPLCNHRPVCSLHSISALFATPL
ncbi:membrane bound acid-phosphatase, putative, partial [Trypanosoma vivax Y486]